MTKKAFASARSSGWFLPPMLFDTMPRSATNMPAEPPPSNAIACQQPSPSRNVASSPKVIPRLFSWRPSTITTKSVCFALSKPIAERGWRFEISMACAGSKVSFWSSTETLPSRTSRGPPPIACVIPVVTGGRSSFSATGRPGFSDAATARWESPKK